MANNLIKPLPQVIYEKLTTKRLFRKALTVRGQTLDDTEKGNRKNKK